MPKDQSSLLEHFPEASLSQKPEDELPSIDEFGERLKKAKPKDAREQLEVSEGTAFGQGFKLASEMLAALLVGGALGFGADRLFGIAPWGLIAGIFIGFAAGIRNAWTASVKLDSGQASEKLVPDDEKE